MTKLFDTLVKPILLYFSEVWGLMDMSFQTLSLDTLFKQYSSPAEKLHLKFCKQCLGTKQSSSYIATLAELGRYPLLCEIINRTTKYFFSIMSRQSGEILKSVAKTMIETPEYAFSTVQNIVGQTNLWKQFTTNKSPCQLSTQCTRLRQTIQAAYRKFIITESNRETKTKLYWTVRNVHSYKSENYLNMKSIYQRRALTKLRLLSHNLSIEAGLFRNTPRSHRICPLCPPQAIGDELHILECTSYTITQARNKFLQDVHTIFPQFLSLANMQRLKYLMQAHDDSLTYRAGQLLIEIFQAYSKNNHP